MVSKIQSYHLHQLPKPTSVTKKQGTPVTQFKDILQQRLVDTSELKISKHAQKRLQDRGIEIDQEKWSQISTKVQEAKTKGVHESLVVLKDAALVVSAKNNTVITVMDRNEAKSQIFTNINGTILMD
ncbi:TIGR02530 family flagellar biosynthesis protein [Bacillaceae bacterium IKA-2]|nr:TIGR02530 family flagellar biosynthesis protein [Bacillaceae bacterium IKA-2]